MMKPASDSYKFLTCVTVVALVVLIFIDHSIQHAWEKYGTFGLLRDLGGLLGALIGSAAAIWAGSMALSGIRKQIAEERASTLATFIKDERDAAEIKLAILKPFYDRLETPMITIDEGIADFARKRAALIFFIAKSEFNYDDRYNFHYLSKMDENIPEIDFSWRVRIEGAFHKLFYAGLTFTPEGGEDSAILIDDNSAEIREAIYGLKWLHEELGDEIQRLAGIINFHRRVQLQLRSHAESFLINHYGPGEIDANPAQRANPSERER